MTAVVVTTKTLYFIMVMRGTWTRVGNPYPSRESANEWKPFVRSAWRGMRTKVEPCVIELHDGKPTPESVKLLDERFNMDVVLK